MDGEISDLGFNLR